MCTPSLTLSTCPLVRLTHRLQPDARRLLEEEAELDEEEEGAIRGVGAFGAARQTLLGKDGQLVQVRRRGRERQA